MFFQKKNYKNYLATIHRLEAKHFKSHKISLSHLSQHQINFRFQ